MGDARVTGAPMPGPNERRYYPIERPRVGKPTRGYVLAPTIRGFATHWINPPSGNGGRTQPCYGEASCIHPHQGAGFHWYGFVPMVRGDGGLFGLLMHRSGCLSLLSEASARGGLVGLDVRVTKSGPANWSPVVLEVVGKLAADKVPAPFDLTDSLCKLWAVDYLPVFAPLLRIAEGE